VGEELQLGITVKIEDSLCRITDALGMGSFGTVWAAEDISTRKRLAVKEIACWSHNELMNALFERHLLRVLSAEPPEQATDANNQPADNGASAGEIATMPSLVGHEVLCLRPKRVRLAMTRVPGVALEDFLEERRCLAAVAGSACARMSPRERFAEASAFSHALLSQLAPVFERISSVAIHRDVNTHNILVDAQTGRNPAYGLVDFGLAVDTLCWCSTENNPETKWRPTRIGVDAVHTWRYLDIAGDCRYWPVSAWTQFLIGWKEIDANPCLLREYQVQLDQHALGITAMKVFVELLSPPPPKETRSSGKESTNEAQGVVPPRDPVSDSDIPNLQMEIWTLLRAWERYWKRISPVHRKLISTFHHGGDWEVLKQMC
jgi:serine/threonine protein kinase